MQRKRIGGLAYSGEFLFKVMGTSGVRLHDAHAMVNIDFVIDVFCVNRNKGEVQGVWVSVSDGIRNTFNVIIICFLLTGGLLRFVCYSLESQKRVFIPFDCPFVDASTSERGREVRARYARSPWRPLSCGDSVHASRRRRVECGRPFELRGFPQDISERGATGGASFTCLQGLCVCVFLCVVVLLD